ncbi:MAG TPA: hypothetical protein VGE67_14595 [Haloferula sp.]
MPALLQVLALLLFLQVRGYRSQVDGRGSSSIGAADHSDAMKVGPVESGPGKPSKVSERPEHAETKIPLAEPVADQPGFVIHPVNGKIVDVSGIPAGLMVQESGAMFVIPKMGYVITSEAYNKAVWNHVAGLGAVISGEGEAGATWSIGGGTGPSVVSCKPIQWETQWDDGTPYVPEKEREEPEQSLE